VLGVLDLDNSPAVLAGADSAAVRGLDDGVAADDGKGGQLLVLCHVCLVVKGCEAGVDGDVVVLDLLQELLK